MQSYAKETDTGSATRRALPEEAELELPRRSPILDSLEQQRRSVSNNASMNDGAAEAASALATMGTR